jgi:DNA-binding GntR family transcriptional regulator
MPVRDALRQLMHEGLLIPDGARHCVVARLGRMDIEDSYLIEGMLHGLAVRRVTEAHDPAQLAELWERHETMCGCGEDVQTFASHNYAFHRRINRMADSRKLNAALRVLALSIPNDFVSQFPQWVDRANAEHGDILAAMKSRKADRADSLTRDHVVQAGRDLISYLEGQGVALD